MAIPTSKVTSAEAGIPAHTDAKHPSSDQAEFIFVPEDFKVKEGAKLADNLFVGKALGVGLQVRKHCEVTCLALSCKLGPVRAGWGVLASRRQWQGRS